MDDQGISADNFKTPYDYVDSIVSEFAEKIYKFQCEGLSNAKAAKNKK